LKLDATKSSQSSRHGDDQLAWETSTDVGRRNHRNTAPTCYWYSMEGRRVRSAAPSLHRGRGGRSW
jgi:hypothetical protein